MQTLKALGGCGQAMQQKQWEPLASDVELVARIAHEANGALCLALGDESQPSWDEAPAWQKESARDGVEFHFAHAWNIQPRDSHDRWMERKLREGWRFGETKDADLKTHPCLLPYESLPDEQKLKDHIFMALCAAYVACKNGRRP